MKIQKSGRNIPLIFFEKMLNFVTFLRKKFSPAFLKFSFFQKYQKTHFFIKNILLEGDKVSEFNLNLLTLDSE